MSWPGNSACGLRQMLAYLFLAFLLLAALPASCQHGAKRYMGLWQQKAVIRVDGILENQEWAQAGKEKDFTFPWSPEQPPATTFMARISAQHLYFGFQVQDKDIVVTDFQKELDVADGDRVELFLAANKNLEKYYCIEISPDARVLDYQASFYRQFDDTWNLPGLQVAAKRTGSGYVVEGSIPVAALKQLGLLHTVEKGACFLLGLYRAEFSRTAQSPPQVAWISWVRPDTAEPDFHVASSFGTFCIGSQAAAPLK